MHVQRVTTKYYGQHNMGQVVTKDVQIWDMSRAAQYKHCPKQVKNERE